MNFFTSLLGEDEAPPKVTEPSESREQDASKEPQEATKDAPQTSTLDTSGFLNFFGTLAKKSEEVLSTYQKDLAEFGKELKKETFSVVDTSAKAIPEVPHLLESGAHQAQNNLEKVGHVIEDFGSSFWRGTTEIFGQVKEAIKQADQEISATTKREKGPGAFATIPRGKYSRFEAQVNAMQRDSSTYCDEPEDAEDYAKWKEEFKLDSKKEEIEKIGKDNAFMQELQSRIVPLIVEYETFWTRYFYRLHKLKQVEEARAGLVKRASALEEEELSWDVEEPGTPSTSGGAPRPPKSPQSLPPVPEDKQQAAPAEEASPDPASPPAVAADVGVTSAGDEEKGAAAGSGDAPRLGEGESLGKQPVSEASPPGKLAVAEGSPPGKLAVAEGAPPGKLAVAEGPPPGKLAVAEGPPPGKRVAAEAGGSEESKKDSPVVPASPTGASEEEGTHSDGSPEGSTGSGWFVVGSGADQGKASLKAPATPAVDEKQTAKELDNLEVDDLDIEEPEGAPEVTRSPSTKEKVKGSEEEGEDWGAWE